MQRFFVDPPINLTPGAPVTLLPPLAHQVGRVLRLRPGAQVILLDGSGREATVTLTVFQRDAVQGEVVACRDVPPAPGPAVTLYAAVLKGDHWTWALQKATELGVAAVVPVVTERTIVPWTEAGDPARQARWARIMREAAEQARRPTLPALAAPLRWDAAVAALAAASAALLPWEEATTPLGPALAAARAAPAVAVAIGPEGGLAPPEIALARAAGLTPVSLGPRILRAETAALAVCALLLVG